MLILLATLALGEEPPPTDVEEAKWSVDAPPGEGSQVPIDVTEGTWMSVDVSPSGDTLVFDLLGDLYTLPIIGGEATALTSGMAWDMQPTWSPDGKRIAFTSDREGGDNLFVIDVASRETTAVTHESFRLFNSPAWMPSGDALLGRKHFTGSRSLGAGEVWMVHLDGGDGLQLVEKANEQLDLGEPAAAPDGSAVYFSYDATGGARFQYNKDPNAGIYAIDRLDLTTGERSRVTGGPGGALRPVPSPDGRLLAFVRRDRDATVLMVRNLESGAEKTVWDGLDRDMQETWAIHGVYPAFDWLPDGSGMVLWAQGGLWKVPLSGAPTQIPFHVSDSREIRASRRHPVDLAPKTVDVRMPRQVAVSPDGTQVAFVALGHLYLQSTSGGAATRFTPQTDHFEAHPAWSADGKQLAWVSWDDDALGAVHVAPVNKPNKARILTTEPGHYVEPVFSPSGESLVFRKATGGRLRTPLWSQDPGLYVASLTAKTPAAPKRLHPSGTSPHFGKDPDRVYFIEEADAAELHSIGLTDRTVRTHAIGDLTTDLRVSPSGDWLAFQEHYNVHLTPFPAPGHPLSVSPKSTGLPVATASIDAGDNLQFANDRLWWTLGPDLYSSSMSRVLDKDFDPESVSPVHLDVEVPAAIPSGSAAILGARIVTMSGDTVIESGAVVWSGDRIVAVGPADSVVIPQGATVLDGAGLTVLPGFVDVHAHAGHGSAGLIPEWSWTNLSMLSFGVTTTHDPSNDTETVFAASELQRSGGILAPRLLSTGTILYGAKGAGYTAKIDSIDDAASHLRRLKAVGAFSVKSYNQPRRDQRQQVLAAADTLDMMVVPEGGSLLQHNLTQVVDGHTGIEHSLPVATLYDDILQLWSGTDVGYTPTLGVSYGGLMGENYWYAQTDVWANERLQTFVPRRTLDAAARRATIVPDTEYNHIRVAEGAKALSDAGVRVNVGAHGQREGLAVHWELWMLEQGGFTPHEALRAATANGAHYLGLDADVGSVEVGKLADFAIVAGNPLDDLSVSQNVRYTVLGGRVYDAATMDQLWPAKVARPKLWFERDADLAPHDARGPRCTCEVH